MNCSGSNGERKEKNCDTDSLNQTALSYRICKKKNSMRKKMLEKHLPTGYSFVP